MRNFEELKEYFSKEYQGSDSFLNEIIFPMLGMKDYDGGYEANILENQPDLKPFAEASGIRCVNVVGRYNGMFPLLIFDITVASRVKMERNRVGVQSLIRRIMSVQSSAFMIFHYENSDAWDWRFTFCSKGSSDKEFTSAKRYTFLLGPNQSCRTAAQNFADLMKLGGNVSEEDMKRAFSVEALSDEFFKKYKEHYEHFVKYITGKVFVKSGSSWVEKAVDEPNEEIYAAFGRDDKSVRDFVKNMMGRIVFLHFLQKKGWLGVPAGKSWGEGDSNFMFNLFKGCSDEQKDDFLDAVLEPLFQNALDTDRPGEYLYDTGVKAMGSNGVVRIPYLNGGLFEKSKADAINIRFPKEFFYDLLEFLSEYNFTIDENDPDDAQVGVDPEMLGRIFENLLEDNKDKGAYYTPKEIVQYMCRQSLIAYLETGISDEKKKAAIEKFVGSYDKQNLRFETEDGQAFSADEEKFAQELDVLLKDVKICDPAIGSGAFPMGLLKELFLCRSALENIEDPAEIKRHIIQNNIYGVDIEKGAVDIARLRFWLSLVVDETEPQPLPNLDFKVMQGNSLLERFEDIDLSGISQGTSYGKLTFDDNENKHSMARLSEAMDKYFDEHNHVAKQTLRNEIDSAIKDLILANNHSADPEKEKRIRNLDFKNNSDFFLWHTWFKDVFNRKLNRPTNRPSDCNGFDIVIGNPPYINAVTQKESQALFEQRRRIVSSKTYVTLTDKWDIYIPFMELGLQLLRSQGVMTMIVPYPLTNQKYAKKLRKILTEEYCLLEIADLKGVKVFENVTISNCIPFVRKAHPNPEMIISKALDGLKISEVLRKSPNSLKQDELNYVWNLTDENHSTNKYSEMYVLGDFCYISKGMVLNADEKEEKGAFKKEDLISVSFDEVHSRKYIEAKDIDKFRINRVRYLEWDTERCPNRLSRPTFRELYDCPKLLFNRLGELKVSIDTTTHYLHSDSMFSGVLWKDLSGINNKSIASSVKRYCRRSRTEMEILSKNVSLYYLLGVLNSAKADELLTDQRGGDYHIYPEHIRNLPIPIASVEIQNEIEAITKEILERCSNNQNYTDLALSLNKIVDSLYD